MRCKRLNAPQYCTALDETKGHGGTSSPTDSTQRKRKEIVTYNKSHPKTSIAINEPRLMVARSVMTRAIAVAQARPVTTSLQCQEERCQVQTARGVLVVFAVALHDRRIILITAGAAKPPGRNQAKDAQCHCGDHEREGKCAADMLTARRRNRLGREGRNGACDGVDDERRDLVVAREERAARVVCVEGADEGRKTGRRLRGGGGRGRLVRRDIFQDISSTNKEHRCASTKKYCVEVVNSIDPITYSTPAALDNDMTSVLSDSSQARPKKNVPFILHNSNIDHATWAPRAIILACCLPLAVVAFALPGKADIATDIISKLPMSYIANVVAKEVFTLFSEHFKRRTPSHTYGVCASPYCVLNVFNMRCITGWTPFRSPRWQSTRTKHRDEKVLCLVIARTYSKAATLITSVDVHHRQYEWECSATRRGHGVVVGRTHDALRAIKNDQFAHAGLRHSHHPGALRRPLRWCLWIKFIARVAHASHTEAPAITGRIWSPRRILPGLGHTAHSRGYYSYQGDTQRAKAGRSRLRHTDFVWQLGKLSFVWQFITVRGRVHGPSDSRRHRWYFVYDSLELGGLYSIGYISDLFAKAFATEEELGLSTTIRRYAPRPYS
ncbi:hypothetical protein DFH94DRAFT_680525 [Russula ochroleuca]|uniref:Uncharacterized protein n=1 Tax=Russula ochroleuca TaxID=152965 RepID=A0A9P5MZG1_9AGAM|nr:hypothetical protein DFH94DRAFT_680525 [Russula ochroleuca]